MLSFWHFFVTSCNISCQNDNILCSHWILSNNISVSVSVWLANPPANNAGNPFKWADHHNGKVPRYSSRPHTIAHDLCSTTSTGQEKETLSTPHRLLLVMRQCFALNNQHWTTYLKNITCRASLWIKHHTWPSYQSIKRKIHVEKLMLRFISSYQYSWCYHITCTDNICVTTWLCIMSRHINATKPPLSRGAVTWGHTGLTTTTDSAKQSHCQNSLWDRPRTVTDTWLPKIGLGSHKIQAKVEREMKRLNPQW